MFFQENDIEWRYSKRIESPKSGSEFIEGMALEKVQDFGSFTSDNLPLIPNEEEGGAIRNELYVELEGLPALSLFKVSNDYFFPHFYVPQSTVYANSQLEDLVDVVSLDGVSSRPQYYLPSRTESTEDIVQISREDILFEYEQNDVLLDNSVAVMSFGERVDTTAFYLDSVEGIDWNVGWAWPETQVNPSSFMYHLVRLVEKLRYYGERDPLLRIDKLVWLSSKRVAELEKYELPDRSKDMLLRDFLDLSSKSVDQIISLETDYSENRDLLKSYWQMIGKVYAYLDRSMTGLRTAGVEIEDLTEAYELLSVYRSWILEDRGVGDSDFVYFFDMPEVGEYELMLSVKGADWEKVRDVDVFDKFVFLNVEEVQTDEPYLLMADVLSGDDLSKVFVIPEWEEKSSYKISFDYHVAEDGVSFKILEDFPDYSVIENEDGSIDWDIVKVGEFPGKRKLLKEKDLVDSGGLCPEELVQTRKVCFRHYENIVRASTGSIGGYLYFELPTEGFVPIRVDILNLRVVKHYEPKVALRKVKEVNVVDVPKINFVRVNPTKYRLKVNNAMEPYTLVFSESFNEGWRLYLKRDSGRKIGTGMLRNLVSSVISLLVAEAEVDYEELSYFDGDINEGVHQKIFLEPSTFETWGSKSIADDRHYRINGFANAWEIHPEDVGQAQDYELIVEFWPQHVFYISLFISSAIVLGCIFFVVFNYIRRKGI